MESAADRAVMARVTRRLMPLLFICYIVCFLDRVNVGFAALQMNKDLSFSASTFGLGSGIFFIGYFIFEIPSNLVLERVGARRWIARIMVSWGIVSACMMFVRTPTSFCVLRFLLGAAEAGFAPGIVLYLTYWFPRRETARAVALFIMASAAAGAIGGPVSGAILAELSGVGGLPGWQWLFLIEGIPSVLLGVVVFFALTDRPEDAHWLAPEERNRLIAHLAEDRPSGARTPEHGVGISFRDRRVWLFSLLYFLIVAGFYGISIWLPQILKGFKGLSNLTVGFLSVAPYIAAAVGMVVNGAHSDRTGERRLHLSISAFVGAAGLLLSAMSHNPWLSLAALSLAAMGIWGTMGPFWAIPTRFLTGTAAAAGIAIINSVGNLSGFTGPYAVGLVKDATHSFAGGLLVLAASLFAAGLLALRVRNEG